MSTTLLKETVNTKISRRSFLKWSAAIVATVSVARLTIATTEELARAAATDWVPTVCLECNGRCGLAVRVDDGVVKKVEALNGQFRGPGKADYTDAGAYVPDAGYLPRDGYNNGKICGKGQASIEQLYNPDRIKYPMKRAGGRGENKWTKISWEDAYDEIALELRAQRGKWYADGLKYTSDGTAAGTEKFPERMILTWGRYQADHIDNFVLGYGSLRRYAHTSLCQATLYNAVGSAVSYEPSLGFVDCDMAGNGDYLLLIGTNPLEAQTSHVAYAQRVIAAQERGTKVVVVDPRKSNTAVLAKGDPANDVPGWVANRPGSEGLIGLGMLKALIAGTAAPATYDSLSPSRPGYEKGYGFNPQGFGSEEAAGTLFVSTLEGNHKSGTKSLNVSVADADGHAKLAKLVGTQVGLDFGDDTKNQEVVNVVAVAAAPASYPGRVKVTISAPTLYGHSDGAMFTEDLNIKDYIKGLKWSFVTKNTGLKQSQIENLARGFFNANKAACQDYRGSCAHTNGLQNSRPGILLNAFKNDLLNDAGTMFGKYKSGKFSATPSKVDNTDCPRYKMTDLKLSLDHEAGVSQFTVKEQKSQSRDKDLANLQKIIASKLPYKKIVIQSDASKGGTVESLTMKKAAAHPTNADKIVITTAAASKYKHKADSKVIWQLPTLEFANHPAGFPQAKQHMAQNLFRNAKAGDPYPIEILITQYSSWTYSMPDSEFVRSVLKDEKKVPYHIAHDVFLGEETAYADIVLPDGTYLERWDTIPTFYSYFRPKLNLRQPVIKPLFEAKESREFYRDLAFILEQRKSGKEAPGYPLGGYKGNMSDGFKEGTRTYNYDSKGKVTGWVDGDDPYGVEAWHRKVFGDGAKTTTVAATDGSNRTGAFAVKVAGVSGFSAGAKVKINWGSPDVQPNEVEDIDKDNTKLYLKTALTADVNAGTEQIRVYLDPDPALSLGNVASGDTGAWNLNYFKRNGVIVGGSEGRKWKPPGYCDNTLKDKKAGKSGNRTDDKVSGPDTGSADAGDGVKLYKRPGRIQGFSLVLASIPNPGDTTKGRSAKKGNTCYRGLPEWTPLDQAGAPADFNLHLISFKPRIHAQSRTTALPSLKEIMKENPLWINPADAVSRNIADGDKVKISAKMVLGGSKTQSVVAKARVTKGMRKGVVALAHSFGQRYSGKFEIGGVSNRADTPKWMIRGDGYQRGGVPGNKVVWAKSDPYGGSVSYLDTLVKVERVSRKAPKKIRKGAVRNNG